MRAIFLLGLNFVRTQWIALAIITVYMTGIGGVYGLHVQRQEVLFFLRWHAGYAMVLATLLAIPALQTERKSRRILAVLSKGIYRWQYLGGLLFGCALVAAFFCTLVGGITWILAEESGLRPDGLAAVTLALVLSAVAASSLGIFFSTFLHPLLAMAATSTVLSFPLLLEAQGLHLPAALFPVTGVFGLLLDFHFQPIGNRVWTMAATALCQIVLFWVAGAMVFARRDVTISPE